LGNVLVQFSKTNLTRSVTPACMAHWRRILLPLINLSIHNSIPLTSTPECKNIWILRDGVGSRQNVQYFPRDSILWIFSPVCWIKLGCTIQAIMWRTGYLYPKLYEAILV
jgi:hypothetical protein